MKKFKFRLAKHKTLCYTNGVPSEVHEWPRGVAVNMSPCHGEDRQFKSDRGRHFFLKKINKIYVPR